MPKTMTNDQYSKSRKIKETNSESQFLLAEYTALRGEILEKFRHDNIIASFGFTGSAAILGWGFQAIAVQRPKKLDSTVEGWSAIADIATTVVFLAPLLLFVVMISQWRRNLLSIFSIASYIRLKIEPALISDANNQFRWEQANYRMRRYLVGDVSRPDDCVGTAPRMQISSIYMGCACVGGLGCILLSIAETILVNAQDKWELWQVALVWLGLLVILATLWLGWCARQLRAVHPWAIPLKEQQLEEEWKAAEEIEVDKDEIRKLSEKLEKLTWLDLLAYAVGLKTLSGASASLSDASKISDEGRC